MALTAMSADDYTGILLLVTGGASGIGHAVAVAALRRGATVAVLDLDPAGAPASAVALHADVTDDASVAESVEKAAMTMGGIDVLVNNAGIAAQGTIETNSLDAWRHVLDVNGLGIVRVTRSALAHLRRSTHAAVVNPCSIAATAGLPERAVYRASKGAVLSLTMAMGADHVGEGIRVTCVNPGTVDTPRVSRLLDHGADPVAERLALAARQPTGRLVTAAEVAAAVLYIGGPAAGSTTGTALAVHGGMSGLRLRHAPTTTWGGDRRIPTLIHRPIPDNVVNGDIVVKHHVTIDWGNS
jgi:NAD(P)-dependent dehydrogenase (short-subunit alcohol dehydrogenase family)